MYHSQAKIESQLQIAENYLNKNKLIEAKNIYLKILNVNQNNHLILEKIADICIQQQKYDEACVYFSKLERLDGNNVFHLTNFAFSLDKIGQFNLALQVLERAKEVNPNELNIYLNETVTLCNLKRFEDARSSALHALKIQPYSAISFNNLGSVFQKLGDLDSAKIAFSAAVDIDPKYMDARINLAGLYEKYFQYENSKLEYEKILQDYPLLDKSTENLIKVKLAYEYLRVGYLKKGWEYYELALGKEIPFENSRNPKRTFKKPKWCGESLTNKTILVWGEQGIGDEIIFATCINDLQKISANIIIECDPRLVVVFHRSFPNSIVRATSYSNDYTLLSTHDDFDYHIPIGSLMQHFRKYIEDFNQSQAYMLVCHKQAKIFEDRLQKAGVNKFRVGISWRSGLLQAERNINYTSILDWGPIFSLTNIDFINLQYGDCETELKIAEEKFGITIIRWTDLDLKNDIDATLSLISRLDYVITIGNAVSSMSAAVGVPTLVASQKDSWDQFGTMYYPSFPSMHLFPAGESRIQAESLFDISAFLLKELY